MEDAWVQSARQGDREAINQLVGCYQQPVFNVCYHMLGERRDAEDATQEVLVKALMNLHSYDPARPFKPWILRIASNECIDRLRRQRDTLSLDGMGEDGAWEWQVGDSPNPEHEYTRAEQSARVLALLGSLPEQDRLIVKLFYWEGLSYSEIEAVTGLSIPAIKSRLFRARRAMASLLVEEGVHVGQE